MSELLVITVDGPSVVGKSEVSKAMAKALRPGLDVVVETAGDDFRKASAAVLEVTGWKESSDLPDSATDDELLDGKVREVLEAVDLDAPRNWGNLNSPVIDDLVSRVGKRPAMQARSRVWYAQATERALDQERDVLIFDGRNPRARIDSFIRSGQVISALDVMLDCSVTEAARRRVLRSQPADFVPTAGELLIQQKEIERRRHTDATRPDLPFVMLPRNQMITFPSLVLAPEKIVDESFSVSRDDTDPFPPTIYFDTTRVDLETMRDLSGRMAVTAVYLSNRQLAGPVTG